MLQVQTVCVPVVGVLVGGAEEEGGEGEAAVETAALTQPST